MTTKTKDLDTLKRGVPTRVITVLDQRWARPDIKSVALLPNCLARQQAKEAGCYEAWQIDRDGLITEGTASNAWIVTAKGELLTRNADENAILNGITRLAVVDIAREAKVRLVERAFTVKEALKASEAFITSTTSSSSRWSRSTAEGGRRQAGPITRKLGQLIAAAGGPGRRAGRLRTMRGVFER